MESYVPALKTIQLIHVENNTSLITKEEEGVCAKVRIQIKQRVTITREAFLARLEIENGESFQLTGIRVEIYVRHTESRQTSTHLFSFSKALFTYFYTNSA